MSDGGDYILNVDDNEANRYLRSRTLRAAGLVVVEAATGAEALAAVAKRTPSVAVLDVRLPDMSGLDVCSILKSGADTRDVLVLQMSATHVEAADRIRGLEKGADMYLTEPTEPAELLACVRALLRLRQAEREREALRDRERLMHEEVRSANARLDALLTSAPVGLGLCDASLRFVRVNEHLAAIDGLSAEDHIGRTPAEVLCGATANPDLIAICRKVLEDGLPAVDVETRMGPPEVPDERFLRTALFPVATSDGIEGLGVVVEDVTRLERTAATLRELDRKKDVFLATLSHELRNPLAALGSGVEILRRCRIEEPTFGPVRDMIGRQVTHLTRLVDDLLDLSRIMHNRVVLQPSVLDLAVVLRHAVATVRPTLDATRHHLEVDVPDGKLVVDGDAVRMEQVFVNLLDNAAKYTPAGGHIRVTGRVAAGEAVVTVQDDGVGMTAELVAHVFEPFTQAESSIERSRGGLGIGLALARQLLDLHGGVIVARSPGADLGSEMEVRLPLTSAPLPGRVEPREEAASSGGLCVLVVDDNRDAADALAALLRLDGHAAPVAYDASSAIDRAKQSRPEVVLLDIGMPGTTGHELAALLRETAGLADAAFIATTGYGHDVDRRRSADAGFTAHLVKPISHAELRRILGGVRPRGHG